MTTVKLSLLSGLQQLRLPEDGHCQAADERMRVYTYYIFSKMFEKIRTFQLNQFNQTLFFTYKALSLCTKCLLESAVHLFTLTERKRLQAGLISWLRYIQPPPRLLLLPGLFLRQQNKKFRKEGISGLFLFFFKNFSSPDYFKPYCILVCSIYCTRTIGRPDFCVVNVSSC